MNKNSENDFSSESSMQSVKYEESCDKLKFSEDEFENKDVGVNIKTEKYDSIFLR